MYLIYAYVECVGEFGSRNKQNCLSQRQNNVSDMYNYILKVDSAIYHCKRLAYSVVLIQKLLASALVNNCQFFCRIGMVKKAVSIFVGGFLLFRRGIVKRIRYIVHILLITFLMMIVYIIIYNIKISYSILYNPWNVMHSYEILYIIIPHILINVNRLI